MGSLKEKIETIKRLSYLEARDRIARDFHDGIAQDLADIIKRLELCARLFKIDPQKAIQELETLRENTQDTLSKTRQAIFDLKSPQETDFNLFNELNDYLKNYQKQNDIKVKLDIIGSLGNLPAAKSKSIFYIITEAFTNIKKHAQAKNAELRLEYNHNHALSIEIKDDGKGFDINAAELSGSSDGKWGLSNMRQRTTSLGGTLRINSLPGQGTGVSVNIPLAKIVCD